MRREHNKGIVLVEDISLLDSLRIHVSESMRRPSKRLNNEVDSSVISEII